MISLDLEEWEIKKIRGMEERETISKTPVTCELHNDGLTSRRPYKQAWAVERAIPELDAMAQAGKLDVECINPLRFKQQAVESLIQHYPDQ